MRKRYACEFYGNMEVYLATEVEAHLTALQAQHAEAMADIELDKVEAIGLLRNAIECMGKFIDAHVPDYDRYSCKAEALVTIIDAQANFKSALSSLVKP